ncbi:hypothetical protein DFH28DRAFT_882136 [Melampsora americana]|nr:hypothetical protein DFH28DRAFT_882136 [Melampsora americana]
MRILNRIINLYNEYINAGGSCRYSMWQLREEFSKIIPFEDPWFHAHFSVLARDAIENNRENGRPVYNIGGDPPPAHIPIRDTLPWIVPHQIEAHQPMQPPPQNQNRFDQFNNYNDNFQQQQIQQHQPAQFDQFAGMQDQFNQAEEMQRDHQQRRGGRRKKRSRRYRRREIDEYDSDPPSSDDTEFSPDEKPQLPFEKRKQKNAAQVSKERQIINSAIDQYREAGISHSVREFERLANKPINFPNIFIKDLLQFKFIDFEKILQEISSGDPDKSKILEFDPNSKKLESRSKQSKRKFRSVGEWRKVTEAYNAAVQMAFPGAEESFEKYFEHLKQSEYTFETWGDWSRVVWYDKALRTEFHNRAYLSYADFDHPELSAIKNQNPNPQNNQRAGPSSQRNGFHQNSQRIPQNRTTSTHYQFPRSPWTGQIKPSPPILKEQICGNWNLNRCALPECPRIHNRCDFIGCPGTHRRVDNHTPRGGSKKEV